MSISIITLSDVCSGVPFRWRAQYSDRPRNAAKLAKADQLDALDPRDLTPDHISAIIGNDSWTVLRCDECGKDCDALARIGDEPDYDVRWLDLCSECLKSAFAKLAEIGQAQSGGRE